MRTIETKVFFIEEHPNKERVFEWIRKNWTDLNDWSMEDIIKTLQALKKEVGGLLRYSIGLRPDQDHFISLKDYDKTKLAELNLIVNDCPLTGCIWDVVVIEALVENKPYKILKALYDEREHFYTDEALFEMCRANQYEFTEDGEFVN